MCSLLPCVILNLFDFFLWRPVPHIVGGCIFKWRIFSIGIFVQNSRIFFLPKVDSHRQKLISGLKFENQTSNIDTHRKKTAFLGRIDANLDIWQLTSGLQESIFCLWGFRVGFQEVCFFILKVGFGPKGVDCSFWKSILISFSTFWAYESRFLAPRVDFGT